MARKPRPKDLSAFDQKIAALRTRLDAEQNVSANMLSEVQGVLEELQTQNEEVVAAAEELRAERQRYYDLFAYAPEGYCETDPHGVIRVANQAAASLLGVAHEELVGKPLPLYIAEPDRMMFRDRLAHPDSSRVSHWEGTLTPRHGTGVIALITLAPVARAATGQVAGYRCLLRNITAQRQVTAHLEAQIAEHTAVLEARTRLLDAVRAITAEISGELHLPEALGLIARRAVTLLGGVGGDIYLWDADRAVLAPAVWVNEPDVMQTVQVRLGEHLVGRIAAERRGRVVNDYQAHPDANPLTRAPGNIAAAVMEPLLRQDQLVGVITVDRDAAAGPFTAEDQHALQLLAGHAAIAIDNARLYGAAQREAAEHARAEGMLQRYSLLADEARDIVLFVRCSDGQILDANRAAVATYGYSHGELLQRRIAELRAPAARPVTREQMALAEGEGVLFETMHCRKDGTYFPVEVSSRGAILEGERVLLSVIRDVSARKRAEEALRLSEEKFAKAFAANPAAVALTRLADGQFVDVNDAYLAVTGFTRDEVIGRSAGELGSWVDQMERERFVRALRETGTVRSWEARFAKKSGEQFTALLSAELITVSGEALILSTYIDITARKAAEAALKDSEERLHAAKEAAGLGIHDYDLINGTIRWDARVRELWGVGPDEPISYAIFMAGIHPDDRAATQAAMDTARDPQGNGRYYAEYRVIHRQEGTARWIAATARVTFADGRAVRLVGTAQDITPRKQAEQQLAAALEKLELHMVNTPLAVIEWGSDFRVTRWSGGAERIFGWSAAEVIGKRLDEFRWVYDEDVADVARVSAGLLEGITPQSVNKNRNYRKDGTVIHCEWYNSALRDDAGQFRSILSLVLDVTAREHADAALRRASDRYALLADTAGALLSSPNPEALAEHLCRKVMEYLECDLFVNYLADETHQCLRLNACAGIPAAEVQKIQALKYGVAVCGCVARDHQRIIAEAIQTTPDERTALVRSYGVRAYCCHPLRAGARLLGTLSFGSKRRDRFTPEDIELMRAVTDQVAVAMERMHSEEALRRAKEDLESRVQARTADLQRLTAELSVAEQRERQRLSEQLHDGLQQLLVGARMQVEMLARIEPDRARLTDHCNAVLALLTQALNDSRSLSAELSPPILRQAGLLPALAWLGRWMEDTHHLTVDLRTEGGTEPHDEGTRILLFQAVRELLLNTVKHAGVRQANVKVIHQKRHIQVSVADRGKGFNAAKIARAGVGGLGLASIRQRLEYLGGTFEIEAEPGHGSRFTVRVPLQPPGPSPVVVRHDRRSTPPAVVAPGRRVRIVLSDDHAVMRQSLARMLAEEPDLEIVGEAADGKQAVELAQTLQPDIVLMDVSMPVMDGIEATRAIRAGSPQVQVVGLSMFEDAEQAQRMRQAGAADYVAKTSATEVLLSAIRASAHRGA